MVATAREASFTGHETIVHTDICKYCQQEIISLNLVHARLVKFFKENTARLHTLREKHQKEEPLE